MARHAVSHRSADERHCHEEYCNWTNRKSEELHHGSRIKMDERWYSPTDEGFSSLACFADITPTHLNSLQTHRAQLSWHYAHSHWIASLKVRYAEKQNREADWSSILLWSAYSEQLAHPPRNNFRWVFIQEYRRRHGVEILSFTSKYSSFRTHYTKNQEPPRHCLNVQRLSIGFWWRCEFIHLEGAIGKVYNLKHICTPYSCHGLNYSI